MKRPKSRDDFPMPPVLAARIALGREVTKAVIYAVSENPRAAKKGERLLNDLAVKYPPPSRR